MHRLAAGLGHWRLGAQAGSQQFLLFWVVYQLIGQSVLNGNQWYNIDLDPYFFCNMHFAVSDSIEVSRIESCAKKVLRECFGYTVLHGLMDFSVWFIDIHVIWFYFFRWRVCVWLIDSAHGRRLLERFTWPQPTWFLSIQKDAKKHGYALRNNSPA